MGGRRGGGGAGPGGRTPPPPPRLGISLDFCNLVDTLLLVFGELLQGGFGSDDGFSLRDEVIAAVTVLYLDNIVFIAESGYILFKYQFHNESFLSGG